MNLDIFHRNIATLGHIYFSGCYMQIYKVKNCLKSCCFMMLKHWGELLLKYLCKPFLA